MKFNTCLVLLALAPMSYGSQIPAIESSELAGPEVEMANGVFELRVPQSKMGRRYQLQYSESLAPDSWTDVGAEALGTGNELELSVSQPPGTAKRFYRLMLDPLLPVDVGHMVFVPPSTFQPDDGFNDIETSGDAPEGVTLSPYYLHSTPVTQEQWESVRSWSTGAGYSDLPNGESKGSGHPIHSISWHDAVKWCNARSEMENLTPAYTVDGGVIYRQGVRNDVVCNWNANGYRLPTQAEWENSARAGASTKFPWGDTISHNQANYMVYSSDGTTNFYDEDMATRPDGAGDVLFHPLFDDSNPPFTSPVGSFPANGFGIHDLVGNVWQWCWDWEGDGTLPSGTDPRGPETGTYRILRGGSWKHDAIRSRASVYSSGDPASYADFIGFRPVRSIVP